MNNLEKLNKALSTEKSNWEAEARWRAANEDWLSVSFDIAVRVLDTLQAKGMTQKELADKMGVSPQFVNKVVKGQENLSLETIAKLSRALGVSLIEVPESEETADIVFSTQQAYEFSSMLPVVSTIVTSSWQEFLAHSILMPERSFAARQTLMYVNESEDEYKMPA
jgi:transcriptional regulator with XRE-family HTH domain